MNSLTSYSKPFVLTTKYVKNKSVIIPLGFYYMDGSIAWRLQGANDFSPLATATVSLEDAGLKPKHSHVFIKSYSENGGMWEGLFAAGLIDEPIEFLDAGHAINGVAHCRVLWEELL